MQDFYATPSRERAQLGSTGFSRTARGAERRPQPEFDFGAIHNNYLMRPTDPARAVKWNNGFYNALSGRALGSDVHARGLAELRSYHFTPGEKRKMRPRINSRALSEWGQAQLENLDPEHAGRLAAASLRHVFNPSEVERANEGLSRDPNYLANHMAQRELDSGVSPLRARQINQMRARWELDSNEGQALSHAPVDHERVKNAMSVFEPHIHDQDSLMPWEHPTGPAVNPLVHSLDVRMRRHRFQNGDALLPLTADLYRNTPGHLHGDLDFPTFHHAVGQLLTQQGYTTHRPEAPEVEIQPHEIERAFEDRGDSTPLSLLTPSPTTPAEKFTTTGPDGKRIWGPLWTPENRPAEAKARNMVDMAHWLEDESRRRGVPVHPLARELYRPAWELRGEFGHGEGAVTPNPDLTSHTHLTSDFDLPLVVRSLDPDKDPELPWHQRLRDTEWTEDEPRGLGSYKSKKGRTVPRLEPFDTAQMGKDRRVATFGELYKNPYTLIRNSAPVGTMFRDENIGGKTLSLPVHIMVNGKRQEVPGPSSPELESHNTAGYVPTESGYESMESPRMLYRAWDPHGLATAHQILHGNELFGHAYKLLADPRMAAGRGGTIRWNRDKNQLVHQSMNDLQSAMFRASRGQETTLVDGTTVKPHDLVSEHAGFADSLQKLVIPLHPEDTRRGNTLLRGLRGVAVDNTIRGLIENIGSPASNIHKMGPVYDWKSRFNAAKAANPDDPSLKLLEEGLKRHVPDFMVPSGSLGSEHLRDRNRDARIIVHDIGGNVKHRSMMERLQGEFEEYAKTGENPYLHLFNKDKSEAEAPKQTPEQAPNQSTADYLFND